MVHNIKAVNEAEHLRADQDEVFAGGDAQVVGNACELLVQTAPEQKHELQGQSNHDFG